MFKEIARLFAMKVAETAIAMANKKPQSVPYFIVYMTPDGYETIPFSPQLSTEGIIEACHTICNVQPRENIIFHGPENKN